MGHIEATQQVATYWQACKVLALNGYEYVYYLSRNN